MTRLRNMVPNGRIAIFRKCGHDASLENFEIISRNDNSFESVFILHQRCSFLKGMRKVKGSICKLQQNLKISEANRRYTCAVNNG